MCLGCDRVKNNSMAGEKKVGGGAVHHSSPLSVRLSCTPRFPSRLQNYWVKILNVAFKLIQVVNRQYMCRPDSDSEILLKLRSMIGKPLFLSSNRHSMLLTVAVFETDNLIFLAFLPVVWKGELVCARTQCAREEEGVLSSYFLAGAFHAGSFFSSKIWKVTNDNGREEDRYQSSVTQVECPWL